jgi:hypothetical protein
MIDIVPKEKLDEVMDVVPREQPFLQGPQKGQEEKFIAQVTDAFQYRNSFFSYLKAHYPRSYLLFDDLLTSPYGFIVFKKCSIRRR